MNNERHFEPENIDLNTFGKFHFRLSDDPGSYIAMHWHNALEVISLKEGSLLVETEQRKMTLTAGNCIVLNPNVLHSTTSISGNKSLLLQVPVDMLSGFVPDIGDYQILLDPLTNKPDELERINTIRGLMEQMYAQYSTEETMHPFRMESLLLELLFQLYSNCSVKMIQTSLWQNKKNRDRMNNIMAWTKEHYAQPISLVDAAGALHLQINYFCRFFKQNAGITYMRYVNEYRLSKIYHDLIVTDIPLNQLLERHGFTNYKVFRTMFRERFHQTPGHLRRESAAHRTHSS